MVHLVGLEPTSLAALEPESSVCANFTTGANEKIVYQKPLRAVNPPSDVNFSGATCSEKLMSFVKTYSKHR